MSTIRAAGQDELRELYRELILDHARAPRHFGALATATHTSKGINPLCGDSLELFVEVDDDGRLTAVRFDGSGCAISVASASLLTETVSGLYRAEALDYVAALTARLSGQAGSGPELGRLRALEGVRDYPSRVKCATLAWHALRAALNGNTNDVSTE